MKHKHAELIKAWADGAIIQYRTTENNWGDCSGNFPFWNEHVEYHIKPEPKPDVVKHINFDADSYGDCLWITDDLESNQSHWDLHLKVVIDGETGKLKKAEVL